jgi:hypothetical protein
MLKGSGSSAEEKPERPVYPIPKLTDKDHHGSCHAGKNRQSGQTFSCLLGGFQIRCVRCKAWSTVDRAEGVQKDSEFLCPKPACGLKCVTCHESLEVGGELSYEGTLDATMKLVDRLIEHLVSSPDCKIDLQKLIRQLVELLDEVPWSAIRESPNETLENTAVQKFLSNLSNITTFSALGAELLLVVQSFKPEAVRQKSMAVVEALVKDLHVAEGGIKSQNARTRCVADSVRKQQECKAASYMLAILDHLHRHLIKWDVMARRSRSWEETNLKSKTRRAGSVESVIPEQMLGFRYIVHNVMAPGDTADLQKAAKKMKQAATQPCKPANVCTKCKGDGRDPEPEYKDHDCNKCMGTGLKSGDSQFKWDLKDGCRRKVLVKHISDAKNYGVIALETIEAGETVVEFVGEVITDQEARSREILYKQQGLFYMFGLPRMGRTMQQWVIDPTREVTSVQRLASSHTTRKRWRPGAWAGWRGITGGRKGWGREGGVGHLPSSDPHPMVVLPNLRLLPWGRAMWRVSSTTRATAGI